MFVSDMAKWISRFEGFMPETVAWRNNNPGNLDHGPRAHSRDEHGHAIYLAISDGWADLEGLIETIIHGYPGLTLETFFAGERLDDGTVMAGGYPGYAPAADPRGANRPAAYAAFMAKGLGMSVKDSLLAKLSPPEGV